VETDPGQSSEDVLRHKVSGWQKIRPRQQTYILERAISAAAEKGIKCYFGAEFEFYLFKTDEKGDPTIWPYDSAGYFDIAPEDRGENIRREICINLEEMGIKPEASHHEEGPGQQEIDFKFSQPLEAADNATTFKNVVKMVAMANGAYADFSPKPLEGKSGNGMHINISVEEKEGRDVQQSFMAGIMKHICEITYYPEPGQRIIPQTGRKESSEIRYLVTGKQIAAHQDTCCRAGKPAHRAQVTGPDR
jgi:glutamine synthetase